MNAEYMKGNAGNIIFLQLGDCKNIKHVILEWQFQCTAAIELIWDGGRSIVLEEDSYCVRPAVV